MKFAEHLSAHITPEWRKQYINYEVSIELVCVCDINNVLRKFFWVFLIKYEEKEIFFSF